jgi:hypothetical protein
MVDDEPRPGANGSKTSVCIISLTSMAILPSEQLVQSGRRVLAHAGVVAGGDFLGAQAHRVVQKGLELDFGPRRGRC